MNTHDIEDRILMQLDGELSPEEEKEFFSGLANNPEHAALYESYRRQERGLESYYKLQSERMEKAPKPVLGRPKVVDVGWRPARTLRYAAAAAVVVAAGLGGTAVWRGHNASKDFGLVLASSGPAQVIGGGGGLSGVAPQEKLDSSSRRLKTGSRGYLEVALPNNTGTLEMNANTTVRLASKSGVELERGEVLLQADRGGKSVARVQTPDLEITAPSGTVSVVRGLRGTEVAVLSGSAEITTNGVRKRLGAGESFSSIGSKTMDSTQRVAWSKLGAKLTPGIAAPTTTATSGTEGADGVTVAAARSVVEPLTSWLPGNTFAFVEVQSIARLLEPTGASSPAELLDSGALQAQLGSHTNLPPEQAQQVSDAIAQVMADPDVRTILTNLTGAAIVGMTMNGPVILVDVSSNTQAVTDALAGVRARIAAEAGIDAAQFPVEVIGTTLFFGAPGAGLEETRTALSTNTPTLFAHSAFVDEVRNSTGDSKITAALSVSSAVGEFRQQDNSAHASRFLTRTGLSNMRTIMAATDFGDQAGNQAVRVTFDGDREGMVSWMDAPGAMTTLKCFSPDVHALNAMKVRDPEQVLSQLLGWLDEDSTNFRAPETGPERELAQRLAHSLGNEIAFGLDNPVLPIPNAKLAVEVLDPVAFQEGMVDLMTLLWNSRSTTNNLVVETATYRDRTIVNATATGMAFTISYAVVEDLVVFGPGQAFVQNSIDTVLDGRSIDKEYAFTQSLPASSGSHASAISYVAVNESVAQAIPMMGQYIPELNKPEMQEAIRSAAASGKGMVVYAVADDRAIDFYMEGVRVGDYRLAGAIPVVAEWLKKNN